MNRRLNYIDTAKGIGIILVVIYHHLLGAEFINNWISSFNMPLFFMITGYLYGYRDDFSKSCKEFVIQKIQGLLYPYFTLSLIVIIWDLLYYYFLFPSLESDSILEIILLTVTTYGYHALWFIPCLFYSSVIFYLLRKYRLHHWITTLIISFVIIFSLIPKAELFLYYPVRFFVRILIGLMFIYIGYIFFKCISRIQAKFQKFLIVFLGMIFVSSIFGYYFYPDIFPAINISVCHIKNPILFLFLALSNSAFIILISKHICNKALDFIGKNSIIILAFHMDLTIEIAYLIEGRIPWDVSVVIHSLTVVVIEIAMLVVMILLINRFVPFLYRYNKLPFKNR